MLIYSPLKDPLGDCCASLTHWHTIKHSLKPQLQRLLGGGGELRNEGRRKVRELRMAEWEWKEGEYDIMPHLLLLSLERFGWREIDWSTRAGSQNDCCSSCFRMYSAAVWSGSVVSLWWTASKPSLIVQCSLLRILKTVFSVSAYKDRWNKTANWINFIENNYRIPLQT